MPRDPFPFPKHENDYTFSGVKQCQKVPFDKPTHIAQNDKPWSRLNEMPTEASLRRNVFFDDQQAIKDSLDFHLKSTYDQHQEFLRSKNQTLFQKETFTDNHGSLKNCGQHQADMDDIEKNKSARVWMNSQKCSIYSIQGTIESPHNASTNRGYSRKFDGGFYST
ncbi:hypothetical protein UPYG_G00004160 [Umbra pygmaea]|uniref:Uncharacterized protein n=1 Tax=Umbra pygmaea TaxID=75934 RepID=A0ABD0XW38_UMBPY